MDNGFFEKSGNGFWKKFIASGFTAIFTAGLFGSCTGRVVAMKEDEDLNSVLEKKANSGLPCSLLRLGWFLAFS